MFSILIKGITSSHHSEIPHVISADLFFTEKTSWYIGYQLVIRISAARDISLCGILDLQQFTYSVHNSRNKCSR